jgi:thiol-disulfide isomerase/thioredoxin
MTQQTSTTRTSRSIHHHDHHAMMNAQPHTAPPWHVSQWFNTPQPLTLAELKGRVVVLHSFQMLCPACVSHGIPQALRIHQLFAPALVTVVGLHTVFEHHSVMGAEALRVFLQEYRVPFPVGIDQPSPGGPVPLTMQAYGLQGTPSVVVIDAQGVVRLTHFGVIDDLHLGTVIGQLLAPLAAGASSEAVAPAAQAVAKGPCEDAGCVSAA